MSYSLENHLIWSQVMKNLSISYTSTLAYKLGHTFIGHCFTLRIIGCCALLARDAPALLFFLLFGNPTTSWSWCSAENLKRNNSLKSFTRNVTCIVVLEHSGTAA